MQEHGATDRKRFPATVTGAGAFIDKMSTGAGVVAGIMMGLASFSVLYEIIARQVFHSPTKWEYEIVIYLMIWFGFLAQSFALKEGAHIKVDIVTARLAPKTREMIAIGSLIMSLFYSVIFTRYAFTMFATSYTSMETGILYLSVPLWPIKAALFVGMLLLSLQALRMLFTECSQLHSGGAEGSFRPGELVTTLLIFFACAVVGLLSISLLGTYGLIVLLCILLFAGVPVGFSLGLTGGAGLFILYGGSPALIAIPIVGYNKLDSFVLVALPLFIFAGSIMQRGGVAKRLFDAASAFVGHLPGGLGVATIVACALLSAMSGSSVATAATIGLIAIPALIRSGYSMAMACGLVAAGGTLGILIPPSNSMILIGVITGESVGKLFMAGLIPGVMLAVMLAITVAVLCARGGNYKPLPKMPWKNRFIALKDAIWVLMLPPIILGGIYTGFFTVTEAAAVAVVYALAIAIATGEVKWKDMPVLLKESSRTVGMVFMIIIGALVVGLVVTKARVTLGLVEALATSGMPGWGFVIIIMALCIILGMFLEGISITLVVIPIIFTLLGGYGFSIIWFAVLFTINMEIGAITPPVGLNLFVIQQIAGTRLEVVLRGVLPFIIVLLIALIIVALFPQLSLWIPGTM